MPTNSEQRHASLDRVVLLAPVPRVRKIAPGTEVRCRASVPTTTFSSAVISPKSRMFWKVRAMPSRVISLRLILASGVPSKYHRARRLGCTRR